MSIPSAAASKLSPLNIIRFLLFFTALMQGRLVRSEAAGAQLMDAQNNNCQPPSTTPLHEAVKNRDHAKVARLLKAGVDIYISDSRGFQAINYALSPSTGDPRIAALFYIYDFDETRQNDRGASVYEFVSAYANANDQSNPIFLKSMEIYNEAKRLVAEFKKTAHRNKKTKPSTQPMAETSWDKLFYGIAGTAAAIVVGGRFINKWQENKRRKLLESNLKSSKVGKELNNYANEILQGLAQFSFEPPLEVALEKNNKGLLIRFDDNREGAERSFTYKAHNKQHKLPQEDFLKKIVDIFVGGKLERRQVFLPIEVLNQGKNNEHITNLQRFLNKRQAQENSANAKPRSKSQESKATTAQRELPPQSSMLGENRTTLPPGTPITPITPAIPVGKDTVAEVASTGSESIALEPIAEEGEEANVTSNSDQDEKQDGALGLSSAETSITTVSATPTSQTSSTAKVATIPTIQAEVPTTTTVSTPKPRPRRTLFLRINTDLGIGHRAQAVPIPVAQPVEKPTAWLAAATGGLTKFFMQTQPTIPAQFSNSAIQREPHIQAVIPVALAEFDIQKKEHCELLVNTILVHLMHFSRLSSMQQDEKIENYIQHHAKHLHLFYIVYYCVLYVEKYQILAKGKYLNKESLESLRTVRDTLLNELIDDKFHEAIDKVYVNILINIAKILCGLFSVDRSERQYLLDEKQITNLENFNIFGGEVVAKQIRKAGIGDEFDFHEAIELHQFAAKSVITTPSSLYTKLLFDSPEFLEIKTVITTIKSDWFVKICAIYRLREQQMLDLQKKILYLQHIEALYSLLMYCGAALDRIYQSPYFGDKRNQERCDQLVGLLDDNSVRAEKIYAVLYQCYKNFYKEIKQCQIETGEKIDLSSTLSVNRVTVIWDIAENIYAIFNPSEVAQAAPPAQDHSPSHSPK